VLKCVAVPCQQRHHAIVCVLVWRSVIQCGVGWCSFWQCGAVWCRLVQCVAVCGSVLQCAAVCWSAAVNDGTPLIRCASCECFCGVLHCDVCM